MINIAGRYLAKMTADPVLEDFLKVAADTVKTRDLVTLLSWRGAMAAGDGLSRRSWIRRRVPRDLKFFHWFNARVNRAAKRAAAQRLTSMAQRLRWCTVLGIDPDRDLDAPLASFETLNDLFTHRPGPGTRPIAAPDDTRVVVAPCDGSYACFPTTDGLSSFVSKQSHFALDDVLGDCPTQIKAQLRGGPAAYIWLSLVDNHRWFAPISGRVVHAERIAAKTHGRLGLFLEDGYLAANTRASIVLEGEDGQRVAIVPVGLAPIDSITVSVEAGMEVRKGDPLGTFEIGGSACLVLFSRGSGMRFDASIPELTEMNTLLNLNYVGPENRSGRRIGTVLGRTGDEQHV